MNVVIDINQIGLVIWGLRSGHRVFCSNTAVPDPELPEIKATWGDIRNLVVVNNYSVQFYALEFTESFKVFTVYRPVNDFGRSGAYVAVTLYIPHQLRLSGVRGLLESISQAYLTDHYSFGEPLNVPDSIGKYQQMLVAQSGALTCDDEFRRWRQSEQNHLAKVVPYNDVQVVDRFFSSPYREDFAPYQEVMFWNLSYLQNPEQFGIRFLRDLERFELNGVDVSEEYQGDPIALISGLTMVSFRRNNDDCLDSYFKKGYYEQTRISFELKKSEFYDLFRFDGTVEEAVRAGILFKSGKTYSWHSGLKFNPRIFPLDILFDGLQGIPCILKAGIYENDMHEVLGGSVSIILKGEDVQYQKTLIIEEFGLRRKIKVVVPDELPKEAGRYQLLIDTLKFVPFSFAGEGSALPPNLSFGLRGFDGTANVDPFRATGLVMLKEQNLSDIEFNTNRYEIRIDGDRFLVKKVYVRIRVVLSASLEVLVRSARGRFGFRLANGTLFQFKELITEIRHDDLPGDNSLRAYYLPDQVDYNVLFPIGSTEIVSTAEEIVISPRMLRVNNPFGIEFWQGSPNVLRRNWVARNGKTYPLIPVATEFSSEADGFQFEILPKEDYYVLNVSNHRDTIPIMDTRTKMVDPNRKVGTVYLFFDEQNGHPIQVFEKDKESNGWYKILLSQDHDLFCVLPFPYSEGEYEKARKLLDPRLVITPRSYNSYRIVCKRKLGKCHSKSLPKWLLYVAGSALLLVIIGLLWFFALYWGPKVGDVCFMASNPDGNPDINKIDITISKYPRYTKASNNILTIYKKYETKVTKGTTDSLVLSFGKKLTSDSDGTVTLSMNYFVKDRSKDTVFVDIPSVCSLVKAETMDDIASVKKKYPKSDFIKRNLDQRAQELVEQSPELLDAYKNLFKADEFYRSKKEEQQGLIERQKQIDDAMQKLKRQYNKVQSMNCSKETVTELDKCYKGLLSLGVSDTDIKCNNKSCFETIKWYNTFFDELEDGSLDDFKRVFNYDKGRSNIINTYFSPEQRSFIANLLVSSSDSYKRCKKKYTGDYCEPCITFKSLSDSFN